MLTPDCILPPVHEGLESIMLFEDFAVAWENSDHDRRLALFLALIKCIRWEIAKIVVPRLCVVIFNMAQPFLLSRAIVYFGSTGSRLPQDTAGDLIRDSAIVFIGIAISIATYEHLGHRAMAMLRSGTTALVYHTMMWLHIDIAHESGAISLVDADIDSVAGFVRRTVCDTWANALQLGLATWLLSAQIGATWTVPVIFAIGDSVSRRQKSWLEATQKRVDFTTKVLGSIKAIKMLGLIEGMVYMIEVLRTEELNISKKFQRIQAARVSLGKPHWTRKIRLEGSSVFFVSQAITSLSLINLLLTPLQDLLFAIPDAFSSIKSLDRSQNDKRMVGLTSPGLMPSLQPPVPLPRAPGNASLRLRTAVLELNNVTIGTGLDHSKHIGRLTLRLSTPSLTMIVGPVGCGKSILLKTILGEIEPVEGEISISDLEVAYCGQLPWIVNKSIRENIIAGSRCYDGEWYRSIIHACCLDDDLREMPVGDNTLIGRQGTKLSKGQRQRIAIARAVYARKPFAFFDDVLNDLDQVTARKVFDRVFSARGILRRIGCIVLFASHSVNHLPQADLVIAFGEDGLEIERPRNSREENIATDEMAAKRRMTRGAANIEDQTRETNGLAIYATAVVWPKAALLLGFLVMEAGLSVLRYVWVTMLSESEDGVSNSRLGFWLGIYASIGLALTNPAIDLYLKLDVVGDYARCFEEPPWGYVKGNHDVSKRFDVVVLLPDLRNRTPVSFLSRIETGNFVSRFSEDMGLIDKVLPCGVILLGFREFSSNIYCIELTVFTCAPLEAFPAIAQVSVVIATVPHIAVAVPFLVGILILSHSVYVRTSRQLRLHEAKTKASLLSHFMDSYDGLVTIRSFGWTSSMTALAVLLIGLAVAIKSPIDPGMLGAGLLMMTMLGQNLSGIILSWTSIEPSLSAISRLKHFVEDTPRELRHRNVINPGVWPAQGAIEFRDVSVSHDSTSDPVLRNITFTLQPGQKLGLCGRTEGQVLFLIISSSTSSLILAILGMAEVKSGRILIDGEDISMLSPAIVRNRIQCLAQEPFVVPGSVRQNLDPLGDKCDSELIVALERVQLWGAMVDRSLMYGFPDCNPLDIMIDDSFLSYGQQQLLCLARHLLKQSTILLLDEPTSDLDAAGDSEIQAVIRSEFSCCTTIMIARNLRTILDIDYVAVIDEGRIVELGNPQSLLSESQSIFGTLYHAETFDQGSDL
ncbi:multidrug resistance-associated protein/mitoxantrone resistance protein, ABC [Aspergillus oryzae 100-8]|uniref:Multidrug resistance-associated protein n=1 Tax=Aspergillus oryzae (strain 3.042) TaxID=1160506 RepID=I8TWM5_ASPO3|nr:multidrug resistance-associated protein [Aspergillus oryzae 3.042]KDE79971.1 multidrug resistance-associated protein/mitoxantrone resistance protein, ABC [Aspergillus oryzae 100-8]|eukprot:EIT78835.1 multidrug resistance-associated protein [Aspergillus oryzae 3.042]